MNTEGSWTSIIESVKIRNETNTQSEKDINRIINFSLFVTRYGSQFVLFKLQLSREGIGSINLYISDKSFL